MNTVLFLREKNICFQALMTTDSSPVIDFYPSEFDTDLNGKQQDWEAVVLIPFIDEVTDQDSTVKHKVIHWNLF